MVKFPWSRSPLVDRDHRNTDSAFPSARVVNPLGQKRLRPRSETCFVRPPSTPLRNRSSDPLGKFDKPLPPSPLFILPQRSLERPQQPKERDYPGFGNSASAWSSHDARHVLLFPQPPSNKHSREKAEAAFFAKTVATFYGFDVVYVALLDLASVIEARRNAYASILTRYAATEHDMLNQVPAEMYQEFGPDAGWKAHAVPELPLGFSRGYSRVFGMAKPTISGARLEPAYVFSCLSRCADAEPEFDLAALNDDAETLVQMVTYKTCWL